MIRAVRPTLVVLVLVAAASSVVATAQSAPAGSPDVLGALLAEVRGLRAAIEQMAAAGPRVQLALGRLQIQEQRVADLGRRLEGTRKNLTEMAAALEGNTREVKLMEERLVQAASPDERREVETALKHLKSRIQGLGGEAQRFQAEEAVLMQDLTAEQGRWSQINQQLDELERSLGRRQP